MIDFELKTTCSRHYHKETKNREYKAHITHVQNNKKYDEINFIQHYDVVQLSLLYGDIPLGTSI